MKTSYLSTIAHGTDAEYRAWRDQLITEMLALGFEDAGDAGVVSGINKTVIGAGARPGANTVESYMVFKTPDDGLFCKMEFGTGTSTSTPAIAVTFGRGSNGAGSLTGTTSTRVVSGAANPPSGGGVTNYITYLCVLDSYMMVCFKTNGASNNGHCAFFCAGDSVDGDGDIDGQAFGALIYSGSAFTMQCVRTLDTPEAFAASSFYSVVPGNVAASLRRDGDTQAYDMWMNVPEMRPFLWAATIIKTEAPVGTVFPCTVVGVTPRDYLSTAVAGATSSFSPANSNGNYGIAVLWE